MTPPSPGLLPATTVSGAGWIQCGSWRWRIAPGFENADALLASLESPERLLQPPSVLLERDGPRTATIVARLESPLPGQPAWFVKRYNPGSFWFQLKNCFRPSRADRAFRLAEALDELGIPTAHPIAIGEKRRFRWLQDAFLITEEVTEACSWHGYELRCPDGPHRDIVRVFARLLAKLHDRQLFHADPARPNFLLRFDARHKAELIAIDLDSLRQCWAFPKHVIQRSLGHVIRRIPGDHRDFLWFLAEYARARVARPRARQLAEVLRRDLLSRRDLITSNRDVDKLEKGGLQWLVRRSRLTPAIERILEAPDDFLARAHVLKPSRSSAVSAGAGVALKRDNYRKWISRVKDAFRRSRALRTFHKAYLLELSGIPTARPIAAAECRRGRLVLQSYFLMEEIPGAATLAQWRGPRRIGVARVADLLAKMHQAGFSHRDLKEGNIVFDAGGHPHLIDLDGLRYLKTTSDAIAAADLARLAKTTARWPNPLSRSDRLRFLLRYCRKRKRGDWRQWWRAIAAAA